MQALQNALQAVRLELALHADSLSWEGGQNSWLGFPKTIPDLFSPQFTRHLEEMVDREVDRFARTLETTNRRTGSAGGKSRARSPGARRGPRPTESIL
jgi:hypothetical protein